MTEKSWNSSTSSVETSEFTWGASSALLSNGSGDFVFGESANTPIAQVDAGDSVTSELIGDSSVNVCGIVEITTMRAHPYVLDNYADYDAAGNPMTSNGGTRDAGGLSVKEFSSDEFKTSFGFGGGYEDGTGLIYLVHRFYSPAAGQFLSIDPAQAVSSSPYSYANDDTVTCRTRRVCCRRPRTRASNNPPACGAS